MVCFSNFQGFPKVRKLNKIKNGSAMKVFDLSNEVEEALEVEKQLKRYFSLEKHEITLLSIN